VICTEDEDLRERLAEIAGDDGVSKAIDCVSGQVGADVSRALAPHGELVVYGALSTHRQTDADKLTIPIFACSLIYETKTVRGFWLLRWFTESPKDRMAAAIGWSNGSRSATTIGARHRGPLACAAHTWTGCRGAVSGGDRAAWTVSRRRPPRARNSSTASGFDVNTAVSLRVPS